MSALLEQVLKLLATETGSLTHHLVLAFSIAGAFSMAVAFQLVLKRPESSPDTRQRRTLLGLGLLLAIQLALFALAGLVWQGVLNPELMPALDRVATLLSLILIAWLWCFPDSTPLADAATLILGVLVATGAVFVWLWWSAQGASQAFNGSWPDLVAQVTYLAVAFLGLVYLLVRRPAGWSYGVSMLVVLAAGSGLHLALLPEPALNDTPNVGSYPSAVRLAQMVAFPFLLLLIQRLDFWGMPAEGEPVTAPAPIELVAPASLPLFNDPQFWQSLLKLAAESDPTQVRQELTALLTQAFQADLCLLLEPPDTSGKMAVACGYDGHNRRYLEPVTLDSRAIPMLSASLRMGRARRFAASSTSPDLASLARLFGLERSGNLLFAPILAPDGHPAASLVLLSPYSGRDWTPEEQAFMALLARLLVQFLQRSLEMNALKEEITRVRGTTRQAQDQAQQALDERQKLRDQVAVLQENASRDHVQLSSLASVASNYEAAQLLIQNLQAEVQELSEAARHARESARQQVQALDGELRLALEEIAYLQSSLAGADQKITELKQRRVVGAPSNQQLDLIRQIAEDLRASLASITRQAESLLSDPAGALAARQRKYVERIKVSSGRMSRQLDDLVQSTAPESDTARLEFSVLDLAEVVRRTVRDNERALREKRLALRMELPEAPLKIHTDAQAIKKVLDQLLNNARTVTPQGGHVLVKARLESSDGEIDYVLIQVADEGAGIAPQDLLKVFSPRPAGTVIPGLNDPAAEMPRLKGLIESMGGRTWIDSQAGQGTTFNVLLPLKPEIAPGNGNGRRLGVAG